MATYKNNNQESHLLSKNQKKTFFIKKPLIRPGIRVKKKYRLQTKNKTCPKQQKRIQSTFPLFHPHFLRAQLRSDRKYQWKWYSGINVSALKFGFKKNVPHSPSKFIFCPFGHTSLKFWKGRNNKVNSLRRKKMVWSPSQTVKIRVRRKDSWQFLIARENARNGTLKIWRTKLFTGSERILPRPT